MRRLLSTLVILVLVFPIQALAQKRSAANVETVSFQSNLVNATLPYNVILPHDYNTARTTRYPVLYLLHGFGGHYTDWIKRTNIADYAAAYRMIVVMPEGNDGWYTDSATVPTDKYETYIVQELIPDVQRRYRTIEARYGRAIAGLSMGGYGAFKFALKYPDRFAFAGSMSGAFGAPTRKPEEISAATRPSNLSIFGAPENPVRAANDVFRLARAVSPERVASLPYFYLDCGTEDGFVGFNRDLAVLFVEKKIRHEYRQLPGDHSWAYWDAQVQEVLKIAAQKMRLPPSGPKRKALRVARTISWRPVGFLDNSADQNRATALLEVSTGL